MAALAALSALPAPTVAQTAAAAGVPSSVQWHALDTTSGPHRLAVLPPSPASGDGPRPVVVALPGGYGTTDLVLRSLDRFWSGEPARRGWWVVALEGDASRYETIGSGVVAALFDWMRERGLDLDRVVLAGVSNGGLGMFWLAAAAPGRFAGLLGLPGRFVGTASEAALLRGLPVHLVVGAEDGSWMEGARATEAVFRSVGVDVRVTVLPGRGNGLGVAPSEVMDWVEELAAAGR